MLLDLPDVAHGLLRRPVLVQSIINRGRGEAVLNASRMMPSRRRSASQIETDLELARADAVLRHAPVEREELIVRQAVVEPAGIGLDAPDVAPSVRHSGSSAAFAFRSQSATSSS